MEICSSRPGAPSGRANPRSGRPVGALALGRIALAACLLTAGASGVALGAAAPWQRGEVVPTQGERARSGSGQGDVATSVLTLCGRAVMLVVQPPGEQATLYAGGAMTSKLRELGMRPGGRGSFELAQLYESVAALCAREWGRSLEAGFR